MNKTLRFMLSGELGHCRQTPNNWEKAKTQEETDLIHPIYPVIYSINTILLITLDTEQQLKITLFIVKIHCSHSIFHIKL